MKTKLLVAGALLGWFLARRKPPQPRSLQQAVTVITGGASGIGKATAHKFARAGAHIVIADLPDKLTTTLHNEFTPYETPVQFIACDITQPQHRQQLIDTVLQSHGQIDIFINNAGISIGGAFIDQHPDAIDRLITVNLTSALHLIKLVLPLMQEQNRGHIVNISSVSALMPPPGEALYSASKAGLNAFSDSLRRELAHTNILVSVVMPVLTRTDMMNDVTDEELHRNKVAIPGNPIHRPEDVADAVLYAVRHNQRDVFCGGNEIELMARLSQMRPTAVDWFFKNIINTERFMETLGKLGETRETQ